MTKDQFFLPRLSGVDMNRSVFLAVPHYDALIPQALPGLMLPSESARLSINLEGGSLLAMVFNRLWCAALNARRTKELTHFAMHHADIQAPPGWLDVLLGELDRTGADVMAAIIPIKDGRGLTTTGVQDPVSSRIRRFTVREVLNFPETFDVAATGYHDEWLMINTGLWVCDFTRPWIEEACFNIRDAIHKGDDGIFRARALSEDWNFSGWCAQRGLNVFATRKVPVVHHGRAAFKSDEPWGDWSTDLGDST